MKKIETALISVYYKNGLDEIVHLLNDLGVRIYSTGGTYDYIRSLGVAAETIEDLTGYPSILGGRVKTLHPKVFGGILGRSSLESDQQQMQEYGIPPFDLVVVDLYPFEETVAKTTERQQIIEKIDIGGISLIRAAAKNHDSVLVVPSSAYYSEFTALLSEKTGYTNADDRMRFAAYGFAVGSHYDTAIFNWLNAGQSGVFRQSNNHANLLRYGENPQQKGIFYGKLEEVFEKIQGKELSYNNLLDLDAGLSLLSEFDEPTFAILKHNNACGLASRDTIAQAYADALAGDPVSAFGGVLVCNRKLDAEAANLINELFFEIIAAPDYENNAIQILGAKKNRVILRMQGFAFPEKQFKSVLNGILEQDRDHFTESTSDFRIVTDRSPDDTQAADLVFANKIVKHTRSNAIVLAANRQLIGSGIGQTSRVDALKHALAKAETMGFGLKDAVMASDAFFPFADSVELAAAAGIKAVVQPGGSVRDQDSIDACNRLEVSMVFTGRRHFKH